MTIHKCKGLECDGNVYLLGRDKIPHPRAKQQWQIDEENRLMYVAITRAKEGFYYVGKQ
jgi:superfamily I DNA/RNA helicase